MFVNKNVTIMSRSDSQCTSTPWVLSLGIPGLDEINIQIREEEFLY